jgi:type IV secretory pathway VirJ component
MVPYTLPQGAPRDVVILFADPSATETAAAVAHLTALHAVVATVDAKAYLKTLAAAGPSCAWLSSDIEALNRSLLRKLGFPEFRLPVLASIGAEGGALVYGLLQEAPSYSFAGGASIGWTPAYPGTVDLCGIGLPSDRDKPWLPAKDIQLPWRVQPAPDDSAAIGDWLDDIDKAELVPENVARDPAMTLADMAAPLIESAVSGDTGSIHDLPVIEMPVDTTGGGKPAPYIAIIYSGDGGWRDLDRTLGQVLSEQGVPVVGLDSLLYFWQPKRPEVVAHDLDRIMDHYRQAWKIDRFVLIGFSFGADIMPFAYNRLSDENKARVAEISLLAPSRETRFEISVSEYFSDAADEEMLPIEPEIARISSRLLQCFYGEEEADTTLCTTKSAAGEKIFQFPGGHHFGDDYEGLAKRIIEAAAVSMKAH